MGKSSSTPSAPDPVATAEAQSAADKETAIAQAALNRIGQVTPYGTLRYEETGYDPTAEVPLYTQYTEFSPDQQALYDLNQQFNVQSGTIANEQLGRLQESLSEPISYEGAPELAAGYDQAIADQANEAIMSRLNPQFDRDMESLEARLASQGIAMGSDQYAQQMEQFGQNVNDARTQAALNAIQLGMSQSQLQNAARQQYVQEAASIRNQPLNEVTALISGTQVQSPQFSNVSQVQLPQSSLTENIYNTYAGQMQAANQAAQQQNALMGGLFGLGSSLGSAAILSSDRRLKRSIKKIGKLAGFNLYRFKYLWDDIWHMGFMAQEVEKTRPDAVVEINGWKAIKYGELL